MKSYLIWKECIDIVDSAVKALEKKDNVKLRTLSNELIHVSSIYQDPVPIKVSIILHSIYKLAEKGVKKKRRHWKKFVDRMSAALTAASEALFRNDLQDFLNVTNFIFQILETADSDFNDYFTHVVERARLNKAWKFYEHGLSLGRAAKLLGENKWEIQDYLGSKKTAEMLPADEKPLEGRYSQLFRLLLQEKTGNGERVFVLDSSAIISLISTSLHPLLQQFKDNHSIQFVTGESVITETVKQGLDTKTHRLSSLQILDLVETGVIDVINGKSHLEELIEITNALFTVNDHPITVLHEGEAECLLVAKNVGSGVIIIDERTTRLLIERPKSLCSLLRTKLHSPVKLDKQKLAIFQRNYCKQLQPFLLRSVELAMFSIEHGLLKDYANRSYYPQSRREILEGVLWALKSKGCTISTVEINQYLDRVSSPREIEQAAASRESTS